MNKKPYQAPRCIEREDLKQITLYTGFGPVKNPKQRPIWEMT